MKKILSLFVILSTFISANAKSLIPGGESAGVILKYNGVLVTGTYAFFSENKQKYLNQDHFQSGDLITKCDNTKIESTDDLIHCIQKCVKDNKEVIVDVKTKDNIEKRKLEVELDSKTNTFKTGLYISDHISAIGTITYYDPETSTYGAFGHPIDVESDDLNFSACELFDAYITSIDKNSSKATGKKIGSIEKAKRIGTVNKNIEFGIFGAYESIYKEDTTVYQTGEPQIGVAYLYTTLTDNKTTGYQIYIDKITTDEQRCIEFHVIDTRLLDLTNGIIPGMSGSPIIQDDQLVGAVTHVRVNNPTQGYGIFIGNMLDAAK